jgi:hypothetical protein
MVKMRIIANENVSGTVIHELSKNTGWLSHMTRISVPWPFGGGCLLHRA